MEPKIVTKCGYFDFTAPDGFAFEIDVIARALSKLCRFTGHTMQFYSVAQHSVFVSMLLEADGPELAMMGLLHDAAEAFVGDVAAPLKILLPEYKVIEQRVERAICRAFGLPEVMPEAVKEAVRGLVAGEVCVFVACRNDVRVKLEGLWKERQPHPSPPQKGGDCEGKD